jgi:glycosyltransferase involved in cell wall biosynthesis
MKYQNESPEHSIIVHSHLSWDGVWQRPQQFLSRLATKYPILFVEAPIYSPKRIHSDVSVNQDSNHPNIHVVKISVPKSRVSDRHYMGQERRKLVKRVIQKLSPLFDTPLQWFYDPMAFKVFRGQFNEAATIYDCMDQLAQFKHAPAELSEREKELLEAADVVFTGGPKLYKAKHIFNKNCHCYGCGVDISHFGQALSEKTIVKEDIARLRKPILGYFGVVDERIDYHLLRKLAESNPHWNIVIIGPTAKVDPKTFPQYPNLHWFGRREYADLPSYCKGFDVCLMPFAINEATEYINPTKAQEYMATGKPIVSTPIEDVTLQFSNIVKIGQTHQEFIDLCKSAVSNPDTKAIQRGLLRAENMTWETIVAKIEQNIQEVLDSKKSYISESSEISTLTAVV